MGSFCGVSHRPLQLGEGLSDRAQVGRIWRQEAVLDIVAEALGVDPLVEHAERIDPVATQLADAQPSYTFFQR